MRSAFIFCGIGFLVISIVPLETGAQVEWTELTIADNFDGAHSVYAEDVDGDGDIDVLGAAWIADDITWWENLDGTGLNWSEHTVDGVFAGASSVYAKDVDGDGDMDVLGAAADADAITWWENLDGAGLNWSEHTVDGTFDDARRVYAEDMDGDGDVDVLGAAREADDITWWENLDGTGQNWSEHTVDGAFDNARGVFAEDVDGDGDMDVLGAAFSAGDITWWENLDGTGLNWSEHTVDAAFSGALSVYAEDVDGDGDMDVLGAAAYLVDGITWWENLDGTGLNWSEHTVDGAFDGAWGVYAEDVDGDGDKDVLGAACNANEITWWENLDGAGLNWSEHTVDGAFYYAICVYAEDVDGDGDMDVLGAARSADDITVWLRMGSPNLIDVTLTPAIVPSIVPIGGNFEYGAELVSNLPNIQYVDVWTEAVLPDNSTYGPIWLINNFPMGPNTIINAEAIVQEIPYFAPVGQYTFRMKAGMYPSYAVGEDEFPLEIIAATTDLGSDANGWIASGYDEAFAMQDLNGNQATINEGIQEHLTATPNPFNSSSTLSIDLPNAAELSIIVYNVSGQIVTQLADGQFNPGTHQFTIDASGMASGIYFVRATVPGHLDQTQKVLLVR